MAARDKTNRAFVYRRVRTLGLGRHRHGSGAFQKLHDATVTPSPRKLYRITFRPPPAWVRFELELGRAAQFDKNLGHLVAAMITGLMQRGVVPRRPVRAVQIGTIGDEAVDLPNIVGVTRGVVLSCKEGGGGLGVT